MGLWWSISNLKPFQWSKDHQLINHRWFRMYLEDTARISDGCFELYLTLHVATYIIDLYILIYESLLYIYMYKAENCRSVVLFQEIPWLVQIFEGEELRECSWSLTCKCSPSILKGNMRELIDVNAINANSNFTFINLDLYI